jgi:hypothetical protein
MGHFSDLTIEKEEDAQKKRVSNIDGATSVSNRKEGAQKMKTIPKEGLEIYVGDIIKPEGSRHDGVITNISISMDSSDGTGDYETAVSVNSYDISLNYKGSVAYIDSVGNSYWCSFNRIENWYKNPEYDYDSNQSTWCGTEEIEEEEEEDDVVVSSSTPQPFFLGS